MTSFEISRSKHKISLKKRILESWQWWLLLLPGLVYLIIFNYIPMGGVVIAFNNYRSSRGIFASKWVGFDNFVRFFPISGYAQADFQHTFHHAAESGYVPDSDLLRAHPQ